MVRHLRGEDRGAERRRRRRRRPPAAAADRRRGPPAATGSAVPCPHCGTPNAPDNLFCEQCGYDFTTGQAPPDVPAEPAPVAPAVDLGTTHWVVIVEIDPAWFALKGELANQQCPAPSSSTVAIAGHTTLVGRTSQSRGVRPEIALDNDTGVSRRHAQFVREADQVSIVDLSSTNGTYVVLAGTAPDEDSPPLTPGVPVLARRRRPGVRRRLEPAHPAQVLTLDLTLKLRSRVRVNVQLSVRGVGR